MVELKSGTPLTPSLPVPVCCHIEEESDLECYKLSKPSSKIHAVVSSSDEIKKNDVYSHSDRDYAPNPPLDAYNLFLHFQFQRMLEFDNENTRCHSFNLEEVVVFALTHRMRTVRLKVLEETAVDRMIIFQDITNDLSIFWNNLSNDQRSIFQYCSQVEAEHYRKQLTLWSLRQADCPVSIQPVKKSAGISD